MDRAGVLDQGPASPSAEHSSRSSGKRAMVHLEIAAILIENKLQDLLGCVIQSRCICVRHCASDAAGREVAEARAEPLQSGDVQSSLVLHTVLECCAGLMPKWHCTRAVWLAGFSQLARQQAWQQKAEQLVANNSMRLQAWQCCCSQSKLSLGLLHLKANSADNLYSDIIPRLQKAITP